MRKTPNRSTWAAGAGCSGVGAAGAGCSGVGTGVAGSGSDSAATSVLERVVAMTSNPAIIRNCKIGEQDPISRWFVMDYSFREFRGRGPELLALIADKLDS